MRQSRAELERAYAGALEAVDVLDARLEATRAELASYPVKQKILVNLKTDTVIQGVLWEVSDQMLILKDAFVVTPAEGLKPLDGQTLLERDNIDFVQILR